MASEPHRLLGLPEMVASILEHVIQRRTLFACTQVNKLWAEESTTVLWRHYPPVNALAKLDNASRIQYYAYKIRDLVFRDGHDMQMLPMLSMTRFPGLVSIQVGWGGNVRSREEDLLTFLQPSLKYFIANGGIRTQEFLMQIATRCPSLLMFDVRSVGPRISSDALLQFLLSMPSLKSFHMHGTRMIPEADAVSLHLSTRRSFIEYTPAREITQELILEAEKVTAHPFCGLKFLCCRAESRAIARLARSVPDLRYLKLALLDSSNGILPALTYCRNLVTLSMKYGPDTHWFPEELVVLARYCSKIQHLELRPYTTIARGPGIKNVHMEEIATNLPLLKYICLGIHSFLTAEALFSLAGHCTDLRECILRGKFDLRGFGVIKRPLFPCMYMLFLSTVVEDGEMTKETVEALIVYHAPQIRHFRGARDWHVSFAPGNGPGVLTLWHPASIEFYWA